MTFQLPAALKLSVLQIIGEDKYSKLTENELKIAGAIAQAGIENEKGVFNIKRQAGFIAFIDKQEVANWNLPDEIYRDLFDVLSGILLALNELSPQPREVSDLIYKNKLNLYRILATHPDKHSLCVIDSELLVALQFSRMINSNVREHMSLAADFCHYLLFHDQNLSMNDLVGYDQKARDFIIK